MTVRLPSEVEWTVSSLARMAHHTDPDDDERRWRVQVNGWQVRAEVPWNVDDAAAEVLDRDFRQIVERGEDREVGRVPVWTARGHHDTFDEDIWMFGTVRGDRVVYLYLGGPGGDPLTERWAEAVLASVEWPPLPQQPGRAS